jgi:polyribonucleotide nucleotidyltransferase
MNNQPIVHTATFGSREMRFELGHIAKQAHGSVVVKFGDTVVLSTVCAAKEPRPGIDFLPLTCDYIEKTFAAGKIPGGFFKREGRPRDNETLTSRLVDRSIRPLFPETWRVETQVIATVLSFDPDHFADTCALNGTSLALTLSNIPFEGPIGAVRVGRVGGKLIANPNQAERAQSDLDLFVACSATAITMVEGGGDEVSEAGVVEALLFAHESVQPFIKLQNELRASMGNAKRPVPPAIGDDALEGQIKELATGPLKQAFLVREKAARYAARDVVRKELFVKLAGLHGETWAAKEPIAKKLFHDLEYVTMRRMIVDDRVRIDGRGTTDIRAIYCEVGLLPRVHGSALFQRGETQGIVTATLGTKADEQRMEQLDGESWKRFMLHYNFPPYSVGETKPMRSPGRREIGHGALGAARGGAPRAHGRGLPVRGAYRLRDHGVQRLVVDGLGVRRDPGDDGRGRADQGAGRRHRHGPHRRRAARSRSSPTSSATRTTSATWTSRSAAPRRASRPSRWTSSSTGVSREILEQALEQARVGRLHILERMMSTLGTARPEISRWAPRITVYKIKPERIKDVIGPGGKVIKDIVAKTTVAIDVGDDGTIQLASSNSAMVEKALRMIKDLTPSPRSARSTWATCARSPSSARSWRSSPAPTACCTSPRCPTSASRTWRTSSARATRCWSRS